jgi:hypothetical protein
MSREMVLYKLILRRKTVTGNMGDIVYYTIEALAVAAGEASGVDYEVKSIWWG